MTVERTTRHELRVMTWNLGKATVRDAVRVIEKASRAAESKRQIPGLVATQETSDKQELVNTLCAEFGYLPSRGTGKPGQAATVLLHDPAQLHARRPLAELMVEGQPLNRGTGPEHMKPKWLIGDYFLHQGAKRRIAAASTHRVSGQTRHGDTIRDRVSREHAAEIRETFSRYTGLPIVLGDWNSLADDDSLAPLRRGGWISDQQFTPFLPGSPIPTHGGWIPDHAWWRRDDRIRYVGHHTIDGTHSDHRPLIVDFELTARPR